MKCYFHNRMLRKSNGTRYQLIINLPLQLVSCKVYIGCRGAFEICISRSALRILHRSGHTKNTNPSDFRTCLIYFRFTSKIERLSRCKSLSNNGDWINLPWCRFYVRRCNKENACICWKKCMVSIIFIRR